MLVQLAVELIMKHGSMNEFCLPDPSLTIIEGWFRKVMLASGPTNIQLSGGDPTMREDLPQVVALGKYLGFHFIQINTNGLRLAHDTEF